MKDAVLEPIISVILPTYNRVRLVKEAINSVLAQTLLNFELIVIDDGSTDDTQKMLGSLTDERIIVITSAHIGRSAARNLGLSMSRGTYITFIDSDDLYVPGKLMMQHQLFEQDKAIGMIYTSADCFVDDNPSDIVMTYKALESGNIYESIAAYIPNTICLPTVMIRREVLLKVGMFDVTLDRFEDIDFWRRISKQYYVKSIDEVTCKIRTHEGNSILNLDGKNLSAEVVKYGEKVLAEDSKEFGIIVLQLVSNFYKHYSKAIIENTEFAVAGYLLLIRAIVLDVRVFFWKKRSIFS